jgi:Lipopolysaccharide kinase (Kdo/WaaP) family
VTDKINIEKEVISPSWQSALSALGFDSFGELWQLELEPVQPPNEKRGGISYVYQLEREYQGKTLRFFVKRQDNYNCFNWSRPWQPQPVCEREWHNASRLEQLGIGAIEPVYFGRRRINGRLQAIFMTLGLDGYQQLNDLRINPPSSAEREPVMRAAGAQVAKLHRQGLVHHCLYGNHIFFKRENNGEIDIRFIDLEKMRPSWQTSRGIWRDFSSFYRDRRGWDKGDWSWVIQGYLGVSQWTSECQQLQDKVERKAAKKR